MSLKWAFVVKENICIVKINFLCPNGVLNSIAFSEAFIIGNYTVRVHEFFGCGCWSSVTSRFLSNVGSSIGMLWFDLWRDWHRLYVHRHNKMRFDFTNKNTESIIFLGLRWVTVKQFVWIDWVDSRAFTMDHCLSANLCPRWPVVPCDK